jgi:Xaa-Pro aminopeptidase
MRNKFRINIPMDLHALYLSCFKARCYKISQLFQPGDVFFFSPKWIENDFMKPVVHPTVLYITMLPNHEIHQNSVIQMDVLDQGTRITIYEFNDRVSGTKTKKEHIILKAYDELPTSFEYADEQTFRAINQLRCQKDDWELLQIVDAIEKTTAGFHLMHKYFFELDAPSEATLESLFMKCVLENGFNIAYLPVCAGDQNGAFIHYSKNNEIIKNNVLLDCGSKNPFGYCADITRCYSKNATSCAMYQAIYNLVLDVKKTCEQYLIDTLMRHEKISLRDLHRIATNKFAENLPQILKKKTVSVDDYFTHFIGHSIGLEVHDTECAELLPGCVFTLEPGLYFQNETNEKLQSIGGIRIEDVYLISSDFKLVCLSAHITYE